MANYSQHCEVEALRKFPPDLFTREQRRQGFIAIHIVAFCYLSGIIVFLVHGHLKGAAVLLLEKFQIRSGSVVSSIIPAFTCLPAFLVSIIGAFISSQDVEGFAVVGCSVFNIFCGLAACTWTSCLKVHWYSIWRDNIWFAILAVSIIWVSADSVIRYTEAALLLSAYLPYALILRFNENVERGTRRVVLKYRIGENDEWPDTDLQLERRPILRRTSPSKLQASIIPEERTTSEPEECKSDSEIAITRGRFSSVNHGYTSDGAGYFSEPSYPRKYSTGRRSERVLYRRKSSLFDKGSFYFTTYMIDYEDGPESPFKPPRSYIGRIFWVAVIPAVCIFYLTIPDCRNPRWRRWWPITIFMSIFWLTFLCYVLLWITFMVADTLQIPAELVSLTLLGFGIGLPNLVSSVMYCRESLTIKNNFPVCHALGSNVFLMSFCLGLPWLLESTVDGKVYIENQGFFYILLLYFAVFMFPFIPQINKWKIDKTVGVIFFLLYVAHMVISSLIEMNVFTYLVPPYCKM